MLARATRLTMMPLGPIGLFRLHPGDISSGGKATKTTIFWLAMLKPFTPMGVPMSASLLESILLIVA